MSSLQTEQAVETGRTTGHSTGEGSETTRHRSGSPALEERLLHKMDSFLGHMETRLDHLEQYLGTDDQEPEIKPQEMLPSPQLLRAWKRVKQQMASNHEKSLHPLTQVLQETDKCNDECALEEVPMSEMMPAITRTKSSRRGSDLTAAGTGSDELDPELYYSKVLMRLHKLDSKLDAFEQRHNVMLKNPSDTLKQLRESLYNYEKALVAGSTRLLHFYELPFQWRENKFIVYGYRFSISHAAAVKSVLHIHNETANIWSHLLGAAFIIYLAFWHYPSTAQYAAASLTDKFIMGVFLTAAVKCMLFSVIWHTYANISTLALRQRFACFDYTGITILIIASIITTQHIALHNFDWLRIGFITFSFLTGIFGTIFAWSPVFDKPESRFIRIGFFIGLAALGLFSFAVSCFKRGFLYSGELYAPLLVSFAWYLSGVVFYGCLIPERWRSDVVIDDVQISDEAILELDAAGRLQEYLDKTPERTGKDGFTSLWWVDYILNSHNIWHLFVLGGVVSHYWAVLHMFATAMAYD